MTASARIIASVTFALLAAASAGTATAQQAGMSFFVTSTGSPARAPTSADSKARTSTARRSPSAAGAGGKTVARLSQHAGAGRDSGGQCEGPDRQGPVAEREGRRDREERRRAARQQQPQQADRADREGRGRERPRRHAEHARHPDRLAAGRYRIRRAPTTRPAATGPRAARARRSSAITTARDSTRARRRCRGTRRTRRSGAVPTLCRRPAARAFSIVSGELRHRRRSRESAGIIPQAKTARQLRGVFHG